MLALESCAAPVLHSWVKQKPERPAPKKRCSPTKKKKGACGLNKIDEPEDSSACCSDPGLDTNMAILQPDLATSPSPTALPSQTTSSPCLPDKLFTTTCTELLKPATAKISFKRRISTQQDLTKSKPVAPGTEQGLSVRNVARLGNMQDGATRYCAHAHYR
ncbi:hypothetical protein Bbelb_291280 [Branchiostoma belcheri]|nr:hypothetical protein Bbelb_291280 [Branchiostoma belcheri]